MKTTHYIIEIELWIAFNIRQGLQMHYLYLGVTSTTFRLSRLFTCTTGIYHLMSFCYPAQLTDNFKDGLDNAFYFLPFGNKKNPAFHIPFPFRLQSDR